MLRGVDSGNYTQEPGSMFLLFSALFWFIRPCMNWPLAVSQVASSTGLRLTQYILVTGFCCSFLLAPTVKNLPVVQGTQVQSLDGKDPLENGMATHSSILAWRIPRTEEPGGLQFIGSQRVRHN